MGSDSPQSAPLTSAEASKGVAPYFLYCTCCRWDSKRLGIAFDTPGGLNGASIPRMSAAHRAAHLQPREANAPEQIEFDHLCKHWAPLMKMNMDIAHGRTHGPPRSATAPSSSRHQQSLQPQLLHEVLHLPAKYLDGGRAPTRRQPAEPMDVVPPYRPVAARAQNKLEAREARRWHSLAEHTTTDGSTGSGISTLEQRWSMPIEQPCETSGLRPQRVRLLTKLCKRCPSCRRILVRPELHTSSSRFKVRLLAADHLPGAQVQWTPVPPGSDAGAVCTVTLTNPALEPMRVALQVDGTSPGVRAELATGSLQLRPSLEALDVEEEAPLERVADGVHVRRNTAMVEVRLRGDGLRRPLQLALRLSYRVGHASQGAVEGAAEADAQTTVLLALNSA